MVPFGARSSSRPGRGSHRRPGQKKAREQPQSPLLPTVTVVYLKKRLIPQSQYHKNTEQLDHCASNFSFQKSPDTEPTLNGTFSSCRIQITPLIEGVAFAALLLLLLSHTIRKVKFLSKNSILKKKNPNIFTSFSPKFFL